MKAYILIILLTVLSIKVNAQNTKVIFIDNTSSIENDELLENRKASFQDVVWEGLKSHGDRVIISYIYENSGNQLNSREYILDIPELKTEGLTKQKKRIAEVRHQKYIKKLRTDLVLKITEESLSHNLDRPSTAILAIFPLLEKWQKEFGAYKLVIYSDMIEFSKYRNHYKEHGHTTKSAFSLGVRDAKTIKKDFLLGNQFLKEIDIQIFFPIGDMDSRPIFQWLPYYWNGVFEIFGKTSSTKYQRL